MDRLPRYDQINVEIGEKTQANKKSKQSAHFALNTIRIVIFSFVPSETMESCHNDIDRHRKQYTLMAYNTSEKFYLNILQLYYRPVGLV